MDIIDNFLPKERYKKIYKTLLSRKFPWYVSNIISETSFKDNQMLNVQFKSTFYTGNSKVADNDKGLDLVDPILKKINPTKIYRIKANLTVGRNNPECTSFHIDSSNPGLTGIYYVNTCNGYTLFEESKIKVESVANRMLIFDNKLRHTGVTCTDSKFRVVINFNWC